MDDPLRVIAEQHGVFLRREALACGYDDKTLARMRRAGILHRVRHGAYCFGDVWATYSTEERHLTLARAVLRTTPGPVVLSHTTALLLHGIAVWGAKLERVHVTRLDDGAARIESDVVHHVALCPLDDVIEVAGLPVVTPTRAVIEAATVQNLESGRQGLPRPEPQFEVYDATGALVAITDFAWHQQRVFGEFDGRVKYGRLLREGEEPGDAVFREKQREDLIRSITGYRCARLVWRDLATPRETGDRFRSVLGAAA